MRNTFNLSSEHKTSVDMGLLIPVQTEEVLPGDTFNQRSTALARVAPLQFPLMHRVELRMHTFYCPTRVLHNQLRKAGQATGDWEDFITGEDETVEQPKFTMGASEPLWDYMGVPASAGVELLAYPMAMYNFCWNEFYRDQHLQTEIDLLSNTIQRCAWQKDYFTIARPTPQQGSPADIPVSVGNLPVRPTNPQNLTELTNAQIQFVASTGNTFADVPWGGTTTDRALVAAGEEGNLAMSIDDLRRTLALQRFAEARMRFGSRYVDYLRYLGINPSDGRLDRPEYLGGGKEILNFSEVLSTTDTTDSNVGDMYGHGIGMGRTNGFSKMFEEHGWVMTFLSARPKTVYQNAVPRKFKRFDNMDYWQKELTVDTPWRYSS